MVETGRRLELDEEETLLALGVETSAGTGSVGNLEKKANGFQKWL